MTDLSAKSFQADMDRRGWKVLGDYVAANRRIELECSVGHRFKIAAWNASAGTECPDCVKARVSDRKQAKLRQNLEQVAKQNGWVILACSDNPGRKTAVDLRCSRGHEFSMGFSRLLGGVGCPDCYRQTGWQAYQARLKSPPETFDGDEFWKGFMGGNAP